MNGGFESPRVANPCPAGGSTNPTAGICTYFSGSVGVPHWTVGGNSIDVNTSGVWVPATGNQSVDLSGDAPGSLAQTITTTRGATYLLRWAVAGNYDCGQPVKAITVSWDGQATGTYTFDTTGHGPSDLGWVYKTVKVTATSTSSTIGFSDSTSDQSLCGATLDAVTLRQS